MGYSEAYEISQRVEVVGKDSRRYRLISSRMSGGQETTDRRTTP